MCRFILPSFNFNVERWKWNDEYRVYVSTAGKCKDEHKRLLPVKINSSGYCMVLTACGHRLVHRLVMKTWRPIPDDENLTVDHLDHNKRNNDVRNLEWVTQEENWRRAAADLLRAEEERKNRQKNNPQYQMEEKARTIKVADMLKVYPNANEAVKEILKLQNPKATEAKQDTIIKGGRRLVAAIECNKKYLGRQWRFVEEEE